MKVCRICLSKAGRLYSISSNGLRSLYHQLTGVLKLETDIDNKLPQWVCAECGMRLKSYNTLRQKGLRSFHILTELLDRVTCITEEDINEIDREQNNLQSSISFGVLDHAIIHQYEVNDDDSDVTDCKPKLKAEEYVSKIEIGDTLSVLKAENEDSTNENECQSDTAVPIQEKDSDIDSDLDDAGLSSNAVNSLSKLLKCNTGNKKRRNYKKKHDDTVNSSRRGEEVIGKEPDSIEDVFVVQKLSLDEQIAELEQRKYSRNYISASFKCNYCYKGFNTEATFARHQLTHSDEWGTIECKLCKRRFRKMHTYCRHMTAHRTLYNCKECGFVANLKSAALQHLLKHKGKVYKCPHCRVEFLHRSSYMSHLRIKHVSEFACDFCGFSFVSAQGVEQHKTIKHAQERNSATVSQDNPVCSSCNIRFVSSKALNTHLRVFHSRNPDQKKRNDDDGAYGNTRTICELCGAKTPDGRAYSLHMRRCHPNQYAPAENRPKPYICEQCGRAFQKRGNLISHSLVHSGLKPFECDQCNMRFKSKIYIQNHITNVHLPKKTKIFHCDICGKTFNNPSNRIRHMKYIHSGLRPFICEICGSSFKTKGDLKAHTTHVHLKKAWPRKKNRGSSGQDISSTNEMEPFVTITM